MRAQVTVTFTTKSYDAGDEVANLIRGALAGQGVEAVVGDVVGAPKHEAALVFTDGGCDLKKGGLGAWAYLIRTGDTKIENSGALVGTTNNRMEMLAVIKALETLPMGAPVHVTSDSEYVIKGITLWVRGWVKNGWKTRNGQPVVNQDLWETLLALYSLHDVKFQHVRGHTGHVENERCDRMCTEEMTYAHKTVLAGGNVDIDAGCMKNFE